MRCLFTCAGASAHQGENLLRHDNHTFQRSERNVGPAGCSALREAFGQRGVQPGDVALNENMANSLTAITELR